MQNILGDSWNYMPSMLALSFRKLNERKDFILRDFACYIIGPSKELPVQS